MKGQAEEGAVLWLTGLSGAGKTTLADGLADAMRHQGRQAVVLDGDRLRRRLNRDLGFSEADRAENVRRIAEVAALFSGAGIIAIVAVIAPLASMRADARAIVGTCFREIYLDASLDVCEARDPKGLYARAREGEIASFTGLSAVYEPPADADFVVETGSRPIPECLGELVRYVTREFEAMRDVSST